MKGKNGKLGLNGGSRSKRMGVQGSSNNGGFFRCQRMKMKSGNLQLQKTRIGMAEWDFLSKVQKFWVWSSSSSYANWKIKNSGSTTHQRCTITIQVWGHMLFLSLSLSHTHTHAHTHKHSERSSDREIERRKSKIGMQKKTSWLKNFFLQTQTMQTNSFILRCECIHKISENLIL